MRILIIMEGFFPGKKYGGPPVSVGNFCTLMSNQQCYIVTHNHDLFEKTSYENVNKGWNNQENCKILYLSDKQYRKAIFKKIIQRIRPDLIYLQSMFQSAVFPCLRLANKYKIKVLLAPRGELCAGALKIKRYKKLAYINILKVMGFFYDIHFQSTSEEETLAIAKIINCSKEKIHYLDNIPSIPTGKYYKHKKISGEGKFVFLSRIHPKKNLVSAIKFFRNVIGDVTFDIYGSIEDEIYWQECQKEISNLQQNIKVNYKGIVLHNQVHDILSRYDAFLFPTFSENYGHVIAESLSVGTPVIISDQTPWNDVNEKKAGWAIPLSKQKNFIDSINNIIANDCLQQECFSKNAIEYFKERCKIEKLFETYNQELNKIVFNK